MPCSDNRGPEYESEKSRFLCELFSTGTPVPDYLVQWWKDHQAYDIEYGRGPHTKETHTPKPVVVDLGRKMDLAELKAAGVSIACRCPKPCMPHSDHYRAEKLREIRRKRK